MEYFIFPFVNFIKENFQTVLYILCICTVLDIFTGIIKGTIQGVMASTKTFDGIKKKIMMFCLVLVAILLEFILGKVVPVGAILIWTYIVMELESILENAIASGLPVPEVLKKAVRNIAEIHDIDNESKKDE